MELRVAIYCRVSTDEQDNDTQLKLCREHCYRQGWKIFREYQDIISGKETSRPKFNKLLEDMRLYKFNVIVITKLDRLGRSLQHLLSLIDEFKKMGVNFVATTQNIDTTSASGKLQMQIMGAFAEYERNIISERTKEALKFTKNVGKRGKDKTPRKKRGVLRKPLTL